jgi:hypothetical protein
MGRACARPSESAREPRKLLVRSVIQNGPTSPLASVVGDTRRRERPVCGVIPKS